MVVYRPGVVLEGLGVVQGFDFALDRFVLDLAIGLAQPVIVGIDPLLARFAVLPDLIPFRDFGHAQAVLENGLDVGLVRQAVGEAHHDLGAFFGEG